MDKTTVAQELMKNPAIMRSLEQVAEYLAELLKQRQTVLVQSNNESDRNA